MDTISEIKEPRYPRSCVLSAVRIPEARLERWLERGKVSASAQVPGTGHRRLFSVLDVATLAAVFDLRRHNVEITEASRLLADAIGQDWAAIIAGNADDIFLCVERYKQLRSELFTYASQATEFLTEPPDGEGLGRPTEDQREGLSRAIFNIGPAVRSAIARLRS